MTRIRQFGALLALLAVLVGVPAVMAATIGNPLHGWSSLKAGDLSDSVVIDILAGIVWVAIWVAWAQFTIAVVGAVTAATKARRRTGPGWVALTDAQQLGPRVPGEFTGIPHLARWLVATALLIGTTAGVAAKPASAFADAPPPAPVAAAAATPASSSTDASLHTSAPGMGHHNVAGPHAAAGPTHASDQAPTTPKTYVVPHDGSGPDTYWDIAQAMLGSGERWHEIWDLNQGRTQADGSVMTQSGLLLPGWTVLVPAEAAPITDETATVVRGDTLTGIAQEHGATEAAVWAANQGRVMSDGREFTDADLILPGDTILIPGTDPAHTATAAPTTGPDHRRATHPAPPDPTAPHRPPQQQPTHTPRPSDFPDPPTQPPPQAPSQSSTPSTSASEAPLPASAAAHSASTPWGDVFAGFGAGLAAGLLGALVLRRRTSWRFARIGHTTAAPPPHLVPVEKATLTHGSAGAADGQFIDNALRSLAYASAATDGAALPDVVAARMTGERLQLRLAEPHPADPPTPWDVDESGLWWSVPIGAPLPISADNAATVASPYPTLVGVGYTNSTASEDMLAPQPSAEKWMLDLERAGAIALTGDVQRCLDLGRFMAAALAVNDWSHHVTVTMVGLGQELVPINPFRLRYTDDLDAAARLLQADYEHAAAAAGHASIGVLDGRLHEVAMDSFFPHVLLVAPHLTSERERLARVIEQVTGRPDRMSVAIVLAGDQDSVPAAGLVLQVDSDGRLGIPELGLDVTAQRLPHEQASGIAEMLDRAGTLGEQPVPPSAGDRPWEQFCDAAGSLRPELTMPRDTPPPSPVLVTTAGPAELPRPDQIPMPAAESSTLLPDPDDAYLDAAATTAEDLQVVAPRVSAEVSARVSESVSELDAALAAWRDPACPLPRLTLLGPVELRAHGLQPRRRAYYTELAAYLASRDHGAQLEQIAEAFAVKNETAAARLKDLRAWLGENPLTGQMHLPDARKSKASQVRGVSVYEIEDLLVDAELFRQLHLRGQARGGEEGIADLEAALELVIGEPYSQRRTGGYGWLIEDRVDEYLKAGIEKVAHTVATWAVKQGELDRADAAVHKALDAMPYAEVPRLDKAAVLQARGQTEAAERLLRDEVCNRDDDGNGPMDLSERTEQIRRRRAWLSAS